MEYWLRMGGPNGISLIAWLVLAPISIFLTIEVVPEGYLPGYSLGLGYLTGLIGHVVTGLVLWIGKVTLFRNTRNRPRPVLMLSWFAVAGAIRGASVAWLLETFEITDQANYLERMRSGAVLVLVWFAVSAVLVDGWKKYSISYFELSDKLARQRALRDAGVNALTSHLEDLIDLIRTTLADALRAGSSTSDIHEAVNRLVRPLAHQIGQKSRIASLGATTPKRRLKLFPVINTALHKTPYNPGWTSLMAVFGTLSSRIWISGWLAILDSLLTALIIWGIFWSARKLMLFGAWVLPIWILTGLSVSVASALVTTGSITNFESLIYLSVNVVVPAGIVSLIGAFDRNANANLEQLQLVIDQLKWETASLEQRAWVEQRRLARFVHSELQARIRAFALRMDFAGRMPTDQEIGQLRTECQRALSLGDRPLDFKVFMSELVLLWEGAIALSVRIDEGVQAQLEADAYATTVAIEIIREAVSNAAKHGKAKNARVSLDIEGDQLAIEVSNDGLPPIEAKPGFGIKTIEELSLSWQLSGKEHGALLEARIPIHLLR